MEEYDNLKEEIEFLRNELDRAIKDREKAAEYGLAVLEEKQNLQIHCEQIENLLESTQLDLKLTKDTLSQLQGSLRKANELGLTHEEGLLQDEEVLRTSVNRLSSDLRVTQHTNQELIEENEKAQTKISELSAKLEEHEMLKISLRGELRNLKMKESQLSADFADLEEENVSLQKQLMQLKQSQVDFESIKYENKQLNESVDELNHEVEALDKLKEIVEKNLVEALELLQREREEKCHLKKELDQRIASNSVQALQALASLGLNNFSQNQTNIDYKYDEIFQEDHDNPTLKKLEADFVTNQAVDIIKTDGSEGDSGFVGDLFSEIHINEVKKLEDLIEKLESEKSLLEKSLYEANENVEKSKQQVQSSTDKVLELENNLNSVNSTYTKFATESEDLKRLIENYTSYESAINQISELQNEISKLMNPLRPPPNHQQSTEIDVQIRRLETEVEDKTDMVNELTNALHDTCDTLKNLSKDLSQVYCMMCDVRSEVPNKNVLEFERVNKSHLLSSSTSDLVDTPIPDSPYIACRKLCDFVLSQVSTMMQIMNRIVEAEKIKQSNEPQTEGIVELKEQNSKLKIMLATKRDQIATLRSVLKSNKNTAETALASLKQRFDTERQQIVNEVQRLRSEVQSLKEDKATFASLRASFAQRCDEYLTQLDELQLTVSKAEEEKKTLNSLLRMAMQQKMEASNRLEDLLNDRDARKPRVFLRGAGVNSRGGGGIPRSGFSQFHPNQQQQQHIQQPIDDRFLNQNSPRFPQRRDF